MTHRSRIPLFSQTFNYLLCRLGFIFSLGIALLSCQNKTGDIKEASEISIEDSHESTKSFVFQKLTGDEFLIQPSDRKLTVIHFWATWCKPCLEEFPEIRKALPKLENDDTKFLFASDEDLDRIISYQEKHNTGLDLIRMAEGSMADFEIYALPTTIILNNQGKEVYRKAGMVDWNSFESIQDLIAVKP
jgi:thiol-disulfide isomerase/thioredoxin